MWQYNIIVSFCSNCLYGRSISSVSLSLLAERKRNNCVETNWLCGPHIRLGALFKRVALGRIRCCLSQAARDVQEARQVQMTMNSPPHANGLQAADYLQVSSFKNHKFLQKHRETNNIERRPGSSGLTKVTAAMDRWQWSERQSMKEQQQQGAKEQRQGTMEK